MLYGPRTVPVRSGHDGSRIPQSFEHTDLLLRAANRDGSRSDPELEAALRNARLPRYLGFQIPG